MFRHQSILLVCTYLTSLVSPQSYFHTTHGVGGSFTSVSHGHHHAGHQAAVVATAPVAAHHHHQQQQVHHAAPVAAVHHVAQPAFVHHQHHVAPVAAYHAPVAHAASPSYGEKCAVEYVEEPAEVCVPTLETKCDQEDGGQALELRTEEECQDVVRTVCVERHNVVDNEVCAYSYTLHPVPTEAKLVEPHWNEVCHQETICLNPHHVKPSYGAPAYCHEEIHEHCALEPVLEPVIRPVTVSLPQPVEVCINKQIVLPYVECEKVKDRHCMVVPRAGKGYKYKIDKCSINLI